MSEPQYHVASLAEPGAVEAADLGRVFAAAWNEVAHLRLAPGERLSAEQVGRLLGRRVGGEPGSPGAAEGSAEGVPAAEARLEELRRALRDAACVAA